MADSKLVQMQIDAISGAQVNPAAGWYQNRVENGNGWDYVLVNTDGESVALSEVTLNVQRRLGELTVTSLAMSGVPTWRKVREAIKAFLIGSDPIELNIYWAN